MMILSYMISWWGGVLFGYGLSLLIFKTQKRKIVDEMIVKIKYMIDIHQCDHENDEMIYARNLPQNKCIRCGEFYR